MRRRVRVEPRRVVFVGVEGKSERAFARFLAHCCEEAGLHLHLDVRPGNGGDSVSIVQEAGRRLEKHPAGNEIKDRLVLLDRDRIKQDLEAGRDACASASRWNIEILFQEPNLEGLLLRLHPGQEQRKVAPGDTMRELRKVWPEYRKPPAAEQLRRRFNLSALRRAAEYDRELGRLLTVLGLEGSRSDGAR
ncbi:MAG: hypothetical protein OXU81_21045 [Gammaproteobacteria bacterium]|nr:hypothetical protein [Gammaproteobacteria bacterium]